MSVEVAKSGSFDALAESDVSLSARSALRIAMRRAAVPQLARAEAAPTPFYDQLMSMVDATALENRRVPQNDAIDAAGFATVHRWRVHPLIPCIAGLIVVASVGRVTLSSDEAAPVQMPVVAAGVDNAPAGSTPAAVVADAASVPVAQPVPKAQPPVVEQRVAEEKPAAENSGGTSTMAAADSTAGDAPLISSASESTSAEINTAAASPSGKIAGERTSPAPLRTGSIGPAAPPTVAPALSSSSAQPMPAPPDETGPVAGAGDEPTALHTARILSGVRLRAGPGNGHAVLATIPGGATVEVVDDCRAWCEVVFTGQRGFVYKGFLDR